jgi:hypothetical protein
MGLTINRLALPAVKLVGASDHPDFREAMDLLAASARPTSDNAQPELVVVAQSRPGEISTVAIEKLRREAPLAGIIGLLGSWCEGESRTGRPWPGVARLYWHEFPAWWRRQLTLRASARCPDWARLGNSGSRIAECGWGRLGNRNPQSEIRNSKGVVVLRARDRDTAETLAEVLTRAGYATIWQRSNRQHAVIHGATVGIWDDGQLSKREANELARFCRTIVGQGVPVVALLDFPRVDCVGHALQLGAAAVLGKPWHNGELLTTLRCLIDERQFTRAA